LRETRSHEQGTDCNDHPSRMWVNAATMNKAGDDHRVRIRGDESCRSPATRMQGSPALECNCKELLCLWHPSPKAAVQSHPVILEPKDHERRLQPTALVAH
jgi:hypothetical protein